MSNDIQQLLKKPAAELTGEEMRMLAEYKEQEEEKARQQELERIHKEQQKVQRRIESLETQLKEKKAQLRQLQEQAASLARKPSLNPITTLKEDSLTDMITLALYEAQRPMGVAEVYEQIKEQMKKHGKGGKSPKQAVGSTLASSGRFESVGRGVYILTDQAAQMVKRALER